MKNISHLLNNIYMPCKAFIIYSSLDEKEDGVYVEAYDMDENGKPINAHPLSISETAGLAEALDCSGHLKREFLKSKGIMPGNVLYINPHHNGFAIWSTPAQTVSLFFKEELGIPCGKAKVPPLIWKATREQLFIYAFKENKKPTEDTPLYYAPFFNIHKDGNVCMGTVDIEIDNKFFLEEFIVAWERYFWNSYFSHLLGNHCPVSSNIVQLWKDQVNSNKKFREDVMIKRNETLKKLFR
jgi:PRTRC genetic system protein B